MFSIDSGGHLRRYVTTLGVAIAAAAAFFGRSLLQAASVLTIPEKDIRALTPDAQGTIHRQQHLADHVAAYGPWIVAGVAVIGVGLAVWGLWGWSNIQADEDEQRGLETALKRAELRALTPTEIAAAQITDAAEDAVAASVDGIILGQYVRVPVPEKTPSVVPEDVRQLIERLARRSTDVTTEFVGRFERTFPEIHLIRHMQISNGGIDGRFDVSVGERGKIEVGQPIYKVRHVEDGISGSVLRNWVIDIQKTATLVGPVEPILVVVTEDESLRKTTEDMLEGFPLVTSVVMSREELNGLPGEEFFTKIGLKETKWWKLRGTPSLKVEVENT